MIQKIDFVHTVSSYMDLVRIPPAAKPLVPIPTVIMGGEGDAPLREVKYLSQDIDRRVGEVQSLQQYGPKNHLKSEFPDMDPLSPVVDRAVWFHIIYKVPRHSLPSPASSPTLLSPRDAAGSQAHPSPFRR
jgi:hypothetical protein